MRKDRVRPDIKKFIDQLNESGKAASWIRSLKERYGAVDMDMGSFSVQPTFERICKVCDLLAYGINIARRTKDERLTYYWWFAEGLQLLSEVPNGHAQFHGRMCDVNVGLPSPAMRIELERSIKGFATELLKWNEEVAREYDPVDKRGDSFRKSIVECLDLGKLDQESWSSFSPCYERKIDCYFDLLFSTEIGCRYDSSVPMKLYYFIQPISWPRSVEGEIELESLWCQTTPDEMSMCDSIIDDLDRACMEIRRTTERVQQNRLVLDDEEIAEIKASFSLSGFVEPGADVEKENKQLAEKEIKRRIKEFSRHQLITPSGMEKILKAYHPDLLDFAWSYHEQLNCEIDCNHKGLIGVIYEEFGWMLEAVEEVLVGENAEHGVLFAESGRALNEAFQSWWWNVYAPKTNDEYRGMYKEFLNAAKIAAAKMAAQDSLHKKGMRQLITSAIWSGGCAGGQTYPVVEQSRNISPMAKMFIGSLKESTKEDRTGCPSITIDRNQLPRWFRNLTNDDMVVMEDLFSGISRFMCYSIEHPDEFIASVKAKYSDKLNDADGKCFIGSELANAIYNTVCHAEFVLNAVKCFNGESKMQGEMSFASIVGAAFQNFKESLLSILPKVNSFSKRLARQVELQLLADGFRITLEQIKSIYPSSALEEAEARAGYFWYAAMCFDQNEEKKIVIDKHYVQNLAAGLEAAKMNVEVQERELMAQIKKERFIRMQTQSGSSSDKEFIRKVDQGLSIGKEILHVVSSGERGEAPTDGRRMGEVRRSMVADGYNLVVNGKVANPSRAAEIIIKNYAGKNGAYSLNEKDSLRRRIAAKLKEAGIRT